MSHDLALVVHALFGAAAMIFFWCALATAKGSPLHRLAGRAFFGAMLLVVVTVAPVVFLRPAPFDPGQVVQMAYLSLCVATVTTLGWTAIRWKSAPERFRGRHFKVLGPSMLLLGTVVLAAGWAKGDPVAVVLSWVGLAYGSAMLHFAWSRAPIRSTWWLSWHLNAVFGLFTAVHGTLLFVAWRWVVDAGATRTDAAVCHALVLLAAVALRTWFGRRRRIPWLPTMPRHPRATASA